MTEKELRQKVVNTAAAWLGCKESDGTHKKIIDTYNAHKPLARSYKVKYTDNWCAAYVSAVAIAADITDILPTECGCGRMIQLFKGLGRWQENDAYTPAAGDVLFYDWDDTGKGDNTGSPDHVGLVASVTGQTIKIIEGNRSDAVGYHTMAVNGKYIRGYGLPDYASKAKETAAEAAAVASHTVAAGDTMAKIAAKYGTTVDDLAAMNAIQNKNLIRVGQVLYLPTAAGACAKLAAVGVINSPDYWTAQAESVKYLSILLVKAAKKITKGKNRAASWEKGLAALVSAGVINTPEYWRNNAQNNTPPSIGALLCALGGAVE